MLITIENFGPIKHFEFDTEKDMYLIFGKNSMGKSYAISLVYLLLKHLTELKGSAELICIEFDLSTLFENEINNINEKLDLKQNKEIDISSFVETSFREFIKFNYLKPLNNSIQNTFNNIDNLQNKFSKNNLKITLLWGDVGLVELTLNKLSKELQINSSNVKLNRNFLIGKKQYNENILYNKDSNEVRVCFDGKDNNQLKRNYSSLIAALMFEGLNACKSIAKVYYLPASRSGLYQALSAFGQIFAELAKSRSFITKSIEIPAISEPLADYFLDLSNINRFGQAKNNDLSFYIDTIEKEILHGVVSFDNETKKIFFIPDTAEIKLDLSVASSMVSEISPIVSYLKYILPHLIDRQHEGALDKEQKPLIFIEEPEAHLHPEVQIKLMEVFARLVKDDKIKIVITSHSNYIFNKASNLVIDNKLDRQKLKSILFESTAEGSIAKDLETDEYGIEDNNFIDAAESLYEEKIELINQLNN